MSSAEILQKLQLLGSEQTRKTYSRHGITGNVYGVSFANLTKLKKQIKQNHPLALQLWESGSFDARCLALMIACPDDMSSSQVEQWINDVSNTALGDQLARFIQKTAHASELTMPLVNSEDEIKQVIGWGIVAVAALNDSKLSQNYFENYLQTIESTLQASKNRTKYAMNNALIAIGSRNVALKQKAQRAARALGAVHVDHGQTACKTPDAYEYIEKVWLRKNKYR